MRKLDEKQGFLNFQKTEESSSKDRSLPEDLSGKEDVSDQDVKNSIDVEEKISCQYCEDVGQCNFCERGKLFTQERIRVNEHKFLKNNKFYAKRRWRFKKK